MKVTLVLEDIEDGSVNIAGEFEPPLDTKGEHSQAQRFALAAIETFREMGENEILSINDKVVEDD